MDRHAVVVAVVMLVEAMTLQGMMEEIRIIIMTTKTMEVILTLVDKEATKTQEDMEMCSIQMLDMVEVMAKCKDMTVVGGMEMLIVNLAIAIPIHSLDMGL